MQRRVKRVPGWLFRNLWMWIFVLPLFAGMAAGQTSADPQREQIPIEKGREGVGEVCVACHTNILRMVQIHKESPGEWRDTVYSMIARGAQLSPDEIEAVIAYLAANSGTKANTTSASPQESTAGPRSGAQQAPEAEGKAILQRSCQQCHDLATASTKKSSESWNQVMAKMMGFGARLSPADEQKLTEYLEGIEK
jgi:mono/diheme cytochrome c family protein